MGTVKLPWKRKPKIDYGERIYDFTVRSEEFITSWTRSLEVTMRRIMR